MRGSGAQFGSQLLCNDTHVFHSECPEAFEEFAWMSWIRASVSSSLVLPSRSAFRGSLTARDVKLIVGVSLRMASAGEGAMQLDEVPEIEVNEDDEQAAVGLGVGPHNDSRGTSPSPR